MSSLCLVSVIQLALKAASKELFTSQMSSVIIESSAVGPMRTQNFTVGPTEFVLTNTRPSSSFGHICSALSSQSGDYPYCLSRETLATSIEEHMSFKKQPFQRVLLLGELLPCLFLWILSETWTHFKYCAGTLLYCFLIRFDDFIVSITRFPFIETKNSLCER